MTEDPIRHGLNFYTYCVNNPVKYVDPSGLVPVLLDYIADKADLITYTSIVTGITYVATHDNPSNFLNIGVAQTINGMMIAESDDLVNHFGINRNNLEHRSGDSFNSLNDTVLAFALMYHPASASSQAWPNGTEYGTYLYEMAGGAFTYGNVLAPVAVNTFNFPALDRNNTLVGWIHTHPNPGTGFLVEQFSGSSLDANNNWSGDGAVTMSLGVPGYLVAPSGSVLRLAQEWTGGIQWVNGEWSGTNLGAIPANNRHISTVFRNILR